MAGEIEFFSCPLDAQADRCGFFEPPVQYLFETAEDNAKSHEWKTVYAGQIANYASAAFFPRSARRERRAEFAELIAFHDKETKATSRQAPA